MVIAERTIRGQTAVARRYYLSSLKPEAARLAWLRRFTAGLLAQFDPEPERTSKPGIKTKRKMCSWRYGFALQALTGQKIMR